MASHDDFGPVDHVSSDANPRGPWPHAVHAQQVKIENQFFEDDATIQFDRLPPLQSWAPLFQGGASTSRTEFIVKHVVSSQSLVKRKLSQSEVDALSESAAKQFRRLSYIKPVTYGLAIAAAAHGRKKFRFPFFTPRGSFNPNVFPSQSIPLLRGNTAVGAWHVLRFLAYTPGTFFASLLFFGSIVRTSLAADMNLDSRLSGIRQGFQSGRDELERNRKAAAERERARIRRQYGLPEPPSPTPQRTQQPAQGEVAMQGQEPQSFGGYDSNETPADNSEPLPTVRARPVAPRAPPVPAPPQPQEPNRHSAWEDSDLFDDDDASSVAAAARRAEQAAKTSQSGGSAWDRVRQQEKAKVDARQAAKSPGNPWERGDVSAQDTAWGRLRQDSAPARRDSQERQVTEQEKYSYGQKEESKAQREFDAMLEAERHGGETNGRQW